MPAITSTIVAVGGLGLSIGQMVQQNKLRRQAEAAGDAAVAQARGITEQNKLLALQVPTEGIELAKEQQARREATLIPTLQKDARTALGGTIGVAQMGAEADLALSAQTADAEYKRDVAVLGEDAAIEKRRADREGKLLQTEIEGAGLAARDASEAGIRAAESAIALGGDLLSGIKEPWETQDKMTHKHRKARRQGERGRRQYERKLRKGKII